MVPGFGVSTECQYIGTSGKKQRACYLTPKTLNGAYFELPFLGCGLLIHLSNRTDSPRFRATWKKIRQKYGIQQEPSLFKGHPLSCQYGDALCSMVPTLECVGHWQEVEGSGKKQRACYLAPKTLSWCIFWAFIPRVWFYNSSFQQVRQPSIPSPVEEDTPKIRDTIGTVFIQGNPLSCQYGDALCSMIPT